MVHRLELRDSLDVMAGFVLPGRYVKTPRDKQEQKVLLSPALKAQGENVVMETCDY